MPISIRHATSSPIHQHSPTAVVLTHYQSPANSAAPPIRPMVQARPVPIPRSAAVEFKRGYDYDCGAVPAIRRNWQCHSGVGSGAKDSTLTRPAQLRFACASVQARHL